MDHPSHGGRKEEIEKEFMELYNECLNEYFSFIFKLTPAKLKMKSKIIKQESLLNQFNQTIENITLMILNSFLYIWELPNFNRLPTEFISNFLSVLELVYSLYSNPEDLFFIKSCTSSTTSSTSTNYSLSSLSILPSASSGPPNSFLPPLFPSSTHPAMAEMDDEDMVENEEGAGDGEGDEEEQLRMALALSLGEDIHSSLQSSKEETERNTAAQEKEKQKEKEKQIEKEEEEIKMKERRKEIKEILNRFMEGMLARTMNLVIIDGLPKSIAKFYINMIKNSQLKDEKNNKKKNKFFFSPGGSYESRRNNILGGGSNVSLLQQQFSTSTDSLDDNDMESSVGGGGGRGRGGYSSSLHSSKNIISIKKGKMKEEEEEEGRKNKKEKEKEEKRQLKEKKKKKIKIEVEEICQLFVEKLRELVESKMDDSIYYLCHTISLLMITNNDFRDSFYQFQLIDLIISYLHARLMYLLKNENYLFTVSSCLLIVDASAHLPNQINHSSSSSTPTQSMKNWNQDKNEKEPPNKKEIRINLLSNKQQREIIEILIQLLSHCSSKKAGSITVNPSSYLIIPPYPTTTTAGEEIKHESEIEMNMDTDLPPVSADDKKQEKPEEKEEDGNNSYLLHAMFKLLLNITKNREIGEIFIEKGGIELIYGLEYDKSYTIITQLIRLLFRNLIEDDNTLQIAMENEIIFTLKQIDKNLSIQDYLTFFSPLVLRNFSVFLKATGNTCDLVNDHIIPINKLHLSQASSSASNAAAVAAAAAAAPPSFPFPFPSPSPSPISSNTPSDSKTNKSNNKKEGTTAGAPTANVKVKLSRNPSKACLLIIKKLTDSLLSASETRNISTEEGAPSILANTGTTSPVTPLVVSKEEEKKEKEENKEKEK